MDRQIIFGPPGTGKTTQLMDRMERELATGIEPTRLAFVSFTKAAVGEARSRAMRRFGFLKRQLPWFRTLHSMCFAALGCDRDAVITDYTQFGALAGLRFSKSRNEDTLLGEALDGDVFLAARSLCAATGLPFGAVQRRYGVKLSGFRFQRLGRQLDDYKKQTGVMEYHDLLERYIKECPPLPVDVAIVDEAQDLTAQQWRVVERAFQNARRMYVAGDDDQCIYEWAGADSAGMLKIPGQQIVLDHSYRLPCSLQQYARTISARIKMRKEKVWHGHDGPGQLRQWFNWRDVEFSNSERWMVLARVNHFLSPLAEILQAAGVAYSWNGVARIKHDEARLFTEFKSFEAGEPLRGSRVMRLLDQSFNPLRLSFKPVDSVSFSNPALRGVRWLDKWSSAKLLYVERVWRNNKTLDVQHPVALTTIHQAKGTEAENVVLCPDVTPSTWSALSDAEHRVFYVGATRAKRRMFLLRPQQEFFYQLPKTA